MSPAWDRRYVLGVDPENNMRELLGQSDQNGWRTQRKFVDAARTVMDGQP